MFHDTAGYQNRISINKKGQPVINCSVSNKTKASLVKAVQKAAEIFLEAGCTSFRLPVTNQVIRIENKKDE